MVTKLIYYVCDSVEQNNECRPNDRVPEHVQEKRFTNWILNARDWSISRNRFFGTPIPLWTSNDMKELVCVGSVKELEELSGVSNISDLHRESYTCFIFSFRKYQCFDLQH